MLKKPIVILSMLLLAGCGGSPRSPHIYVIGVDCSRSFWNAGLATAKRYNSLPRNKVLATSNRVRENLNELNIILEDNDFVKKSPAKSTSFVKTIDRETLRKELDNAIDMVTALNTAGDDSGQAYAVERIRGSMNSFLLALEKRNYIKTADLPEGRARMDEEMSPESMRRARAVAERISGSLDIFTYTINVPDQPQLLRAMGNDVNSLLRGVVSGVSERMIQPIDQQWAKRNVYGKMKSLDYLVCFKIGDDASTAYKPAIQDVYSMIDRLAEDSSRNGLGVFSSSTDYESFFQRSFREIGNLMSDWGSFDHDIGIKITFVVIGDGKNDPLGKYESSGSYDVSLIAPIKEIFARQEKGTEDGSVAGGLPWDAVSEVDIRFCVPQRRYNTDFLDAWTKQLQGTENGGKVQVRYYMFENLKNGSGQFSMESIANLLE